ncbi:MAG: hypothetical protein KDD33_11375 [Bdellovibrionales bacterium]|nr:hypothetical protein [Bdellovibrionales bacterium]
MKIYQFPEIYQDWIEKRLGSLHYTLRQPQKLAAAILKASDLYQQDDSLSPWQDADFRAAYYCYFFPLNYVRSLKAIDEAKQLGFFHAQQKYVDYGCGPGTLSAALRDQEIPMKSLVGTDHDLSLKTDYLALSHGSFDPRGKTIPLKGKTLLASYVLNELKEPPAFWLQADSIFLIEPATHQAFKKLLAFRDQLLREGFYLWAPCPHSFSCPLTNSRKDWCHDRVHWKWPQWFADLQSHLPMKNYTLTMSYLIASRNPPPKLNSVRIIGDELKEKGKSRWMICQNDQRQFLSFLHRQGHPPELHRGQSLKSVQGSPKGNEIRISSKEDIQF